MKFRELVEQHLGASARLSAVYESGGLIYADLEADVWAYLVQWSMHGKHLYKITAVVGPGGNEMGLYVNDQSRSYYPNAGLPVSIDHVDRRLSTWCDSDYTEHGWTIVKPFGPVQPKNPGKEKFLGTLVVRAKQEPYKYPEDMDNDTTNYGIKINTVTAWLSPTLLLNLGQHYEIPNPKNNHWRESLYNARIILGRIRCLYDWWRPYALELLEGRPGEQLYFEPTKGLNWHTYAKWTEQDEALADKAVVAQRRRLMKKGI